MSTPHSRQPPQAEGLREKLLTFLVVRTLSGPGAQNGDGLVLPFFTYQPASDFGRECTGHERAPSYLFGYGRIEGDSAHVFVDSERDLDGWERELESTGRAI